MLVINLLVMEKPVALALSLMLLGEAVVLVEDLRRSVLATLGVLAIYSLGVVLRWGWEDLPAGLVVVLPLALLLEAVSKTTSRRARVQDRRPVLRHETAA